ncbi:unnamed protein product [Rhizoctonia solani]|uniref:Uncharacterized protein n=1 Tax=Rhizoctonia solani TaxID=456999 RepID=A0A8H3EGB9_9AGAM|nr:unnamed protein product [Rhizoctonia solani]
MDDITLGVNAAGNPAFFHKDFLAMLGKMPTTTTTIDVDSIPPDSDATGEDAAPFDAQLLGLVGSKKGRHFVECIHNAFEGQSDNIRDEWMKAGEALMDEKIETDSPSVVERRDRLLICYRSYVHHQDKNLPLVKAWEESVFNKHWTGFLIAMITCSRGRYTERVRVNTFRQWCTDLMWLVGKHMVNSDGIRVGTKALTIGGLYRKFQVVSARLCTQFELNREPLPRLWIGHLELLLIYQTAVERSEKYGRAPALQTILCTTLVFELCARIGSLGWSNEEYLNQKRFMKCGDAQIERMDYGMWDADINLINRKGWNSAVDSARPIKYRLSAVTKTHNLWFDAPMLLLLHLMRMGALDGIHSISDIFNYERQYFVIKEEFRDKPLFLERTHRGMDLKPDSPASANGMTQSFAVLGREAGFLVTNYHALRRDGATVYGIIFGANAAQEILGHQEADSTYANHYSKGVTLLPITEARLGLLNSTLSLQQRVGIQRHRREGLAANALLRSGLKLSKLLPKEGTNEPVQDEDEDENGSGDASKPPRPEKKKGTRGNAIIQLTTEQEADVMLDLLIRTTQKTRNAAAAKIRRKVRTEIEQKEKQTERENPTVHPSEDMQEARKRAEDMANVVNLPKPSEQLKALGSIRTMSHFGKGLLSEDCRKLLSSADIIDRLQEVEDDEANEREDRLADAEDDDDPKQDNLFSFKDVEDLKVLDADLVETKKEFMSLLIAPLVVEEVYDQLAREHNGEYPCLPCEATPEEHRPRIFGNKLGQTRFKNRVGLHRHEERVHTPWFDLIQYMFTDDPKIFKCPTEGCPFRNKTIEEIREHCVTNCKEHELYQGLQEKHEKIQQQKRIAEPSRERLNREKDEHLLRGPGLKLRDNIFEGVKKISDTSPEKALELAEARGIHKDQVLPHLRGLAAMNERARSSIDDDGMIKDPDVKMPMERVSKLLLTPELDAKINARLAKK